MVFHLSFYIFHSEVSRLEDVLGEVARLHCKQSFMVVIEIPQTTSGVNALLCSEGSTSFLFAFVERRLFEYFTE